MNAVEIVAAWLKKNGYDGLYSEEECACLNDNLAPCGVVYSDCQAGYRCDCDGELDCCDPKYPCGFHIGPKQ